MGTPAQATIRNNFLCHLFVTKWTTLLATIEKKAVAANSHSASARIGTFYDSVARVTEGRQWPPRYGRRAEYQQDPTHQRGPATPQFVAQRPGQFDRLNGAAWGGRNTRRSETPAFPRPPVPTGICRNWWLQGACHRTSCSFVHSPETMGAGAVGDGQRA